MSLTMLRCWMRSVVLFLLLPSSFTAFGQSLMPVTPQQCVWRAGDDADGKLGWANPSLDESGWAPYADWTVNPHEPRIWVRCHVDHALFFRASHPAVQVAMRAAYQIFFDGRLAGGFGDMRTGDFTQDYVRTFPLPMPLSASGRSTNETSTIALRILMRALPRQQSRSVNRAYDKELTIGEQNWLQDHRDSLALAQGSRTMPVTIAFGIVGVAGFMLLGLYLSDRSRLAFLFLAVHCWALALRRMLEQLAASFYPISVNHYVLLDGLLLTLFPSLVLFSYALAHKRVPWLYRIAIGLLVTSALEQAGRSLMSASLSLRLSSTNNLIIITINLLWVLLYLSPFTAFWPWRRISGSKRYAAAALMAWGIANEAYIAVLLSLNFHSGLAASSYYSWNSIILQVRAFFTLAAVVALLTILFHEQRKTAQERALLAGELDAAREIQQRLVPAALPDIPGLRIEAAYLPAAEVGGDFYQVIPQATGSTLIVVGDVSGKGLKAAMTGVLAIGALRALAKENPAPAVLLGKLNQQIFEARQGGFITCLCALLHVDGTMLIANAGHLNPYRNGTELACDNGLPLGLAEDLEYAQTVLQLEPGDQLTLLTDGVLEARIPATGELYGFERTAVISNESAAAIAAAAQTFGQDDDITVLTLNRI